MLAVVVGTRPQYVKLAPLLPLLPEHYVVDTGQHYTPSLAADVWNDLNLPSPQYNLEAGSGPQQVTRILQGLDQILRHEPPDLMVVFGDTNSTLAAAVAASRLNIPIAHIEAGLRCNAELPEERNRRIVDHLSSLLFCPSSHSVRNLSLEGIVGGVIMVGDIMHDTLKALWPRIKCIPPLPGSYVILTMHREETCHRMHEVHQILEFLEQTGEHVLFLCHPRMRDKVQRGVIPRAPVPYTEMMSLVANARLVVTDSGGLQKEAFWLQTPVVTLRSETEWPETVETGWNTLVGLDVDALARAFYPAPPPYAQPLYVGNAAHKIASAMKLWLSLEPERSR